MTPAELYARIKEMINKDKRERRDIIHNKGVCE
jgi:hypothetical protein